MAHVIPKGIGASSGYSSSNGHDGRSEGILADVTPYNTTNKVSKEGGDAASGGGGMYIASATISSSNCSVMHNNARGVYSLLVNA